MGIDPIATQEITKLRNFVEEVKGILAAAEKVKLVAQGGGAPASNLRKARLALRAALDRLAG